MTRRPEIEFVYLVTVDSEWPVTAIADDHPSTPDRIERAVQDRKQGRPLGHHGVRVWRARLADLTEVEFVPAHIIPPEIKDMGGSGK
jgi:hypothetical protein